MRHLHDNAFKHGNAGHPKMVCVRLGEFAAKRWVMALPGRHSGSKDRGDVVQRTNSRQWRINNAGEV
jgi:hypothetical protein